MGWTFTRRERGENTMTYLSWSLHSSAKIVASSARLDVCYLAVERDGVVSGVVVLTRWDRNTWHNFGTKWIDETMGPYATNCPLRIIDMLSPVEEAYPDSPVAQRRATEWRKACRETDRRRRRAATVRPGDLLLFHRTIMFTDGSCADRLVFIGGSRFSLPDFPRIRVRITNWRERDDWTNLGDHRAARTSGAFAAVAD